MSTSTLKNAMKAMRPWQNGACIFDTPGVGGASFDCLLIIDRWEFTKPGGVSTTNPYLYMCPDCRGHKVRLGHGLLVFAFPELFMACKTCHGIGMLGYIPEKLYPKKLINAYNFIAQILRDFEFPSNLEFVDSDPSMVVTLRDLADIVATQERVQYSPFFLSVDGSSKVVYQYTEVPTIALNNISCTVNILPGLSAGGRPFSR